MKLTFALHVVHSHDACNHASEIATLGNVSIVEAQTEHELMQDSRRILTGPFGVEGWAGGEGVAWERGNDDVVGQGIGGVLATKTLENFEEFEEGTYRTILVSRVRGEKGICGIPTWPAV